MSAQQQALFSLLSTYSDLLLPCRPYPTAAGGWAGGGGCLRDAGPRLRLCRRCRRRCRCSRSAPEPSHASSSLPPADAPDPLLDAVLLHALSHCAKAADRIKKNNDRLRGARDQGAPALDAVPKDQGFTRAKVGGEGVQGGWAVGSRGGRPGMWPVCVPRWRADRTSSLPPSPFPLLPLPPPRRQVLLLLPQRNLALRVVSRLLALAVRETRTDTIQHKQRFLEEFGEEGEQAQEGGEGRAGVRRVLERRRVGVGRRGGGRCATTAQHKHGFP